MYTSQRFPPHLQYVATLPCESWKCKNVTKFSHWMRQLICLTKIYVRFYVTCHKNIALMIVLAHVCNKRSIA